MIIITTFILDWIICSRAYQTILGYLKSKFQPNSYYSYFVWLILLHFNLFWVIQTEIRLIYDPNVDYSYFGFSFVYLMAYQSHLG